MMATRNVIANAKAGKQDNAFLFVEPEPSVPDQSRRRRRRTRRRSAPAGDDDDDDDEQRRRRRTPSRRRRDDFQIGPLARACANKAEGEPCQYEQAGWFHSKYVKKLVYKSKCQQRADIGLMMCTNAQVAQKVDACEGKDVGSKCIYTFFDKQWAGKCFLNSMQAHPWAGKYTLNFCSKTTMVDPTPAPTPPPTPPLEARVVRLEADLRALDERVDKLLMMLPKPSRRRRHTPTLRRRSYAFRRRRHIRRRKRANPGGDSPFRPE